MTLFRKGAYAAPVSPGAVRPDFPGFTFGIFDDPPGQVWADFVHRTDEFVVVVEGSVEMHGDAIRVIVQLVDSATGFHILSRTFDRPKRDFFAIRDEITQLTVSSLRVTLPESSNGSEYIELPTKAALGIARLEPAFGHQCAIA